MKVASLEIDLLANIARLQQDMSKAVGTVSKSMGAIERSVEQAKRVLASLGVGVGFGALISQTVKMTDAYTNLHGQLKNATRSQAELAEAMANVRRIATTAQADIQGVGTSYARLSNNLRDVGVTQAKVADITETVALALKVNGATVEETASALIQLSQAFGKGKLDGDEFRTMMEASPNVMRRVAEGMGVPFGALKDLAAQGKITARVLAEVLSDRAFLDSVREQAKEMRTIGGAMIGLKNALLELVGTQAKASGFVSLVTTGIGAMADNLDGVGRALMFLAATAIPAAVRALWTLTGAMMAVPGVAIIKLLSVAAGALLAFGGHLSMSTESTRAFGAAWDVVSNAVVSALDAIGTPVRAFFNLFEIEPNRAASAFNLSFKQAFMDFARDLDGLAEMVTGQAGVLVSIFTTMGANIAIRFKNWTEIAQGYIFKLTDQLNGAFNLNLPLTIPSGSGDTPLKSFIEEANRAYAASKRTFGAVEALNKAFASRTLAGLDDAFDISLLDGVAAGMGKVTESTKGSASAYAALIASIRAKTEESKLEMAAGEKATDLQKMRIKIDADLATGKLKLSAAQKAVVEQELRLAEAAAANLELSKMRAAADKQKLDLSSSAVKSAFDEARQNEALARTFGMTKSAIERMTIAQLEAQLTQKEALGLTAAQTEALELLIDAHRRNASALASVETKEAFKKAQEDMLQEWQRVNDQVGQSLTDALLRGFESGKSAAENFRDTLKNMFRTLILQPIIQPVMTGVAGSMQNLLGMGPQAGVGGGGGLLGAASNLNSAYSAFSGGLTSKLSNGIGWLGEKFGSTALQTFASGMVGGMPTMIGSGLAASLGTTIGSSAASAMATTTFSASLGGAGAAGAGAASGVAGMGAAFGAALPWIGGALAIGSLFAGDIFGGGKPKTRHGQSTTAQLMNGSFGITSYDDRVAPGSGDLVKQMAEQSVRAANELFRQVGIDAAIEAFHATMESSVLGDRQGVASGGTLRAGGRLIGFGIPSNMTGMGFGGWSSAEMLPRLATDIQLSILEAFQSQADQLPKALADMLEGVDVRGLSAEDAASLANAFQLVVAEVNSLRNALATLPFENLKELSFDAAAGLLQLAGGMGNLLSAQQAYYQVAYSDAERAGLSLKGMASALEAVNVAMPATMAELRNIAEALDLNTEAGRASYMALISIAPELAATLEAIDQVAQDTASSLIAAFTGRGGLMPAMDAATLTTERLGDVLVSTYSAAGSISRLFLDLESGILAFGSGAGEMAGDLTDAQRSSLQLTSQIRDLSLAAKGGIIDFEGLSQALAGVNAETFVATITKALENLASRISNVIGDIASERMALREAANNIIGAGPMTPEAIRAQMAGINTALPSNAAAVAANQSLEAASAQQSAAASALATRQREAAAAGQASESANRALAARSDELANAQSYLAQQRALAAKPATGGHWVEEDVRIAPWIWEEMESWIRDEIPDWRRPKFVESAQASEARAAQAAMPGAQAEVDRLIAAQQAAQSAANAAATALANSTAAAQGAASAKALADQKLEAAAAHARQAQLEYVGALQQFSVDAAKSVSKLSQLRAETVRYYEAQKALAELMGNSAAGLRKTVEDYRTSQLSPERQFEKLQAEYAQAYSMALSTDGESLAGYGDKMDGMLSQLLEAAQDYYGSQAQYDAFANTAIARAEAVAARLDTLAPQGYERQALDLLGQIDTTLAALDASARTAEQLVVDAINAGRDATVNGLRQIMRALTGQSVAAFAAGGDHIGGLRIVGERGPELEATGPSRIFNANQTRSILSGAGSSADLVAEVRALRAEVANQRIELRAIATTNAKMARQGDRLENEGLVVRTDADTPLHVVENA